MTFPVAPCSSCQTTRLTYADVQNDTLVRRCLHCDTTVPEETIQWLSAQETIDAGYDIEGAMPTPKKKGCGEGECGVVQPTRPRD